MKKLVMFLTVCLLLGSAVYAQDPGMRDTIIIEGLTSDSGYTFITTKIWAVTDDSVMFYNLPITWHAPLGGVTPSSQTNYFPPLTSWDVRFDSVCTGFIRQIGFADVDTLHNNPPLLTNGSRVNCWNLRFNVAPGTRPQEIAIDTVFDDRNLSAMFGLIDGLTQITPVIVKIPMQINRVGIDDENPMPVEFALKQNYPNPFNPETNIEFSLAKETYVSLTVFNLLGQEVQTIVNGTVEAGNHIARWNGKNDNGANVPSGIYFYRIYTPDFAQTNKMVLVR
jgi:hypothetical protein